MYREFYNLEEKPFNLTPSPKFLYLGENHKEALALLTYGVVERKGFILLTGEVGTGKTTMVHALLGNLDESVRCIFLSNPLLSQQDFIDYLAFSAFKQKAHFKSKTAFLLEFESYLKENLRRHRNVILIIDEAHKLSFELLEEIRLLSNMELADEKLINIFLIGQPELNKKLSEPRCRPLLQRISSRYHIHPLDLEDTRKYIENRLRVAGKKKGDEIFSGNAVKAVYQLSGGYPRMINILADNALLLGYAKGIRKINARIIRQCFDDLRLDDTDSESAGEAGIPAGEREARGPRKRRLWRWPLAALAVMGGVLLMVARIHHEGAVTPPRHPVPADSPARARALEKKMAVLAMKERALAEKEAALARKEKTLKEAEAAVKIPAPAPMPVKKGDAGAPEPAPAVKKPAFKTVTVRPGDTLLQLAADIYGRADAKTLGLVQRFNPGIKDINLIEVGEKIRFPAPTVPAGGSAFTVHVASFKPFRRARELFQKLAAEGYDAFIVPAVSDLGEKVFRVTLGNFKSRRAARAYAEKILKRGVSGYAVPLRLETK